MNIQGKIALITGASSGIGFACAEAFAEAGARLILLARREERLRELAENLAEKFGTKSLVIPCDVRNRDDVRAKLSDLPEEWSDVEILINNAGLSRGLTKIHEGLIDDWEEMIDANVKGLLYVSRAILPKMAERKSGTVINIASIAGREVYQNGNVYCATKAAVRTLSNAMRLDLNGTNVRVCNLDPGLVQTEFSEVRFHGDTERAEKVYQGYTPLSAKDIASTALYVAACPPHITIADVLILPTDQASATMVHKNL